MISFLRRLKSKINIPALPERPGAFRNIPEFLEHSGAFGSILEHSGAFRSIPEHSEAFRGIRKGSGSNIAHVEARKLFLMVSQLK